MMSGILNGYSEKTAEPAVKLGEKLEEWEKIIGGKFL
jgi:hypothetical protein